MFIGFRYDSSLEAYETFSYFNYLSKFLSYLFLKTKLKRGVGILVIYITMMRSIKSALATAISLKGGITVDIAVVDTTNIQFTITYSSSGWVGFGFGTWMWTNDLLFFYLFFEFSIFIL